MIDKLNSLFNEQGRFFKFTEIDFDYINVVYGSPEQLYGISIYENEQQLIENWEHAADELAVKIQGRLSGQLKPLKWDMYLILLVQAEEIKVDIHKKIENNRLYFKKIILTKKDYPFVNKIPLNIQIKQENEFILFNDFHFLQELKSYLSPTTIERVGNDFFEGNFTSEEFYQKFMLPYTTYKGEN